MGSLFKTPKPAYRPPSYSLTNTQQNHDVQNVKKNAQQKDQETSSPQQSDDEERVKKIINRQFRGRNSTIQTSYRGVLGKAESLSPQRKNLLGE